MPVEPAPQRTSAPCAWQPHCVQWSNHAAVLRHQRQKKQKVLLFLENVAAKKAVCMRDSFPLLADMLQLWGTSHAMAGQPAQHKRSCAVCLETKSP
eukprot:scaffold76294_cov19-Tisochrysis_lutea.AAC.2